MANVKAIPGQASIFDSATTNAAPVAGKRPKDVLLDAWVAEGHDFDGFYKETAALDARTKQIDFKTSQIELITVREVTQSGNVCGYVHNGVNPKIYSVSLDELTKKHGGTPELIAEMTNESMLGFRIHDVTRDEDDVFFVSAKILKTLCQRAGCPIGEAALRKEPQMRFYRDAMYACYMRTVPTACHVVFREVDGAKKAFAVLSGRHAPIEQTGSIRDTIKVFDDEFGAPDLKWWRVSNRETAIYVEYPEKAKDFTAVEKDGGMVNLPDEVIPGVYIRTADTGDSSFKVIGTMKIGNAVTFVPGSRFMRTHTKNADPVEIIDRMKKQVFAEYARIPNRLCELLAIDVDDPVKTVEKVAAACGIRKTLGIEAEKQVKERIVASLNARLKYTAYDVAVLFLEEGPRFEEKHNRDDSLAKIRGCFVQAAFYPYEEL